MRVLFSVRCMAVLAVCPHSEHTSLPSVPATCWVVSGKHEWLPSCAGEPS
jgi:hypothetical protein